MLAGYFLGRNITWNKAFNRALWLFIPFMFWNVLYVLLVLPHDGAPFRLENLVGIRDVFLPGINLFPADDSHAVPPIGPSWFLRDIIILTLLTPLLVRVKILLFLRCSSFSVSSMWRRTTWRRFPLEPVLFTCWALRSVPGGLTTFIW
ncbi:hypothetical protein M5E88_19835 [Akkermansia muciniphila]|nr:hypothetical protein M5E88_19835 [Akkermansia muciniphila]